MRKRKQYVELVHAAHRVAGRSSVLEGMTPTATGKIRQKQAGAVGETLQKLGELIDPNGPVPPKHPELGPCWIWTGPLTHGGYGPFRQVWEVLTIGYTVLHRREVLHHRCEVKACCNPDHLERMPHGEHMRLHAQLRIEEQMGRPKPKLSGERCTATRADGSPCKGYARVGGTLCALHLLETKGNPYDTYVYDPEQDMRDCFVEGCDSPVLSKGQCRAHFYDRVLAEKQQVSSPTLKPVRAAKPPKPPKPRAPKPVRERCAELTTRGKPCNGYAQGDTGLCRYHLDVLASA